MMGFGLYLLYAYVQAVLYVRFVPDRSSDPVVEVVVWTVFAPVLTIGWMIAVAWIVTEWLAGGRKS